MNELEKLVLIFEMIEKLGYDISNIKILESIELKNKIIKCIENKLTLKNK